jgi:RHS repeat-associated protein
MKTIIKTIYISILLLMCLAPYNQLKAQLYPYNYVRTRVPRTPITTITELNTLSTNKDSVNSTYTYVDGLGRPIQTVQQFGNNTGTKDIVQPMVYDVYGRQSMQYLPYAIGSATGDYRPEALTPADGTFKFYNPPGSSGTQQSNGVMRTVDPVAETGFESSPVNRVIEQGAPGAVWQLPGVPNKVGNGHTVRHSYVTNSQTAFNENTLVNNPGSRRVALYKATINSNFSRTLIRAGDVFYASGQLYVTVTRDENFQESNNTGCIGTTEEYRDKNGKVVLMRSYRMGEGVVEMLSTYYVYDDRGNLCFVLPPISLPDNTDKPTATLRAFTCYQYRYDTRNRLTQKKLPGKGWDFIVYNRVDQPVLTQDSTQRLTNQWTAIKYDAMGRVIITALWDAGSAIPLDTLSKRVYAGDQWDSRNPANATTGYTANTYPAISTILGVNYYDNLIGAPGLPSTYAPSPDSSMMSTGLLAGTRTTLLNNTARRFWSIMNYDDEGRVIQAYKQHFYRGIGTVRNYNVYTTTYNFNDQPTTVVRQHYSTNIPGTATILGVTVNNKTTYDHLGRPLNSWQQLKKGTVGADSLYLVSAKVYNEIGQLWQKKLHTTDSADAASFLDIVKYAYNPRGWLSYQHDDEDKLNIDLYYNDPTAPTKAQYNGNIAQFKYEGQYSGIRTFGYAYDALNQLTDAVAAGSGNNLDETSIHYDRGGNIQYLHRGGQAYTGILDYTYLNSNKSNQLANVQATGPTGGFTTRNYLYDGNGNATTDGYTKNIAYNMLNLPQTVTQSATTLTTYNYTADGAKLRTVAAGDSVDYDDGIQYTNSVMEFIATSEGRANIITGLSKYTYMYNLTDHLGNVRATIQRNYANWNLVKVMQENEYYSFGLRRSLYDLTDNRYLYNGKEIQNQLTNQYDYGARFYDPVIARWTSVDPLAEMNRKWNPYGYVKNNPVRNIDPDGMIDYIPLASDPDYDRIKNKEEADAAAEQQEKVQAAADKWLSDIIAGTANTPTQNNQGSQAQQPNQRGLRDMSSTFDSQIRATYEDIQSWNKALESQHYNALSEYATRLLIFTDLVKTNAKYDLKNHGYSQREIGTNSLYHGQVFRFDDYGNFNYGVAARAFNISLSDAIRAAGLNQLWNRRQDWSNAKGWFDDSRDTQMIINGYNSKIK